MVVEGSSSSHSKNLQRSLMLSRPHVQNDLPWFAPLLPLVRRTACKSQSHRRTDPDADAVERMLLDHSSVSAGTGRFAGTVLGAEPLLKPLRVLDVSAHSKKSHLPASPMGLAHA
jgi:hypothetical protein